MAETTIQTLPVLPLSQGVVLPQMVVTIALETDEARAVAAVAGTGGRLLLVPRVDGRYAEVGTVASVEDRGPLPNGSPALVVRAERRARVGAGVVGDGDALWVQAELVEDSDPTDRTHELAREYRAAAGLLMERLGGRRMSAMLRDVEDPGALADTAGWWPDLSLERKVELLEATDVDHRLELVTGWVKEALADGELADRIRSDVSEGMEKNQREFLLRQQLAAIRRELGEEGDDEDGIEAYRARLADRDIPADVGAAIERELGRLERTSPQAAESGWIRTWLDTIVELPWGVRSPDHLDLGHARAVLDADHSGLDEVKDRIVEELAVRKLRLARQGEREAARAAEAQAEDDEAEGAESGASPSGRDRPSILVLVGPPGVGKTSLGESVARALGRKFVRVALGGVRDEAEIRGHRRTYVGAQPGRIVRAMVEAGTMNPVFLLDEIDKVGSDWRGDPSSALLEVLDPAQNHSFRDHYLEVDLDLSNVLFIATANVLDSIPAPLLDRMEIITLDGYTDEEKVVIARDHLLDRQLERNGLRSEEVSVTDEALATLVSDYTREAGVRSLERQLGKVLRKTATKVAVQTDSEETAEPDAPASAPTVFTVDVPAVREALGRARVTRDEANRTPATGVVNGLAVTGAGGDVLVVEATAMDGEQGLTLTGQLGDVMTESGQIALSFIRANRDELGIDQAALERRIHVHFPAGAVPKDGPSAGVTMTTALASLLSGRPVKPSVAMTGEVTLQGKVLPIGGVKQKLLAAHRAGITDVIIPARNEPDLDDLPDTIRDGLVIHPVADVREVLELALEPADAAEPLAA